jgi:hypothetical protein
MTNPTPPSSATQAVITAIEKFDWEAGHFSREEIWFCSREVVAAALRAAADQVVPVPIDAGTPEEHWALLGVKNKLLAIADELEGVS